MSRATCYNWLRRFRDEGPAGLADAPATEPPGSPGAARRARDHAGTPAVEKGPHWLASELGRPRSTIYGVLRRHGMSRLDCTDRPTGVPIRYERAHPGELVHVDVKKFGRIPDGGGWGMLGGSTESRRNQVRTQREGRLGYDYIHAAVDDHSRVAYVEVHRDERGQTCAGFLARAAAAFAEHGTKVEAVMTDNAWNYRRSRVFLQAMRELEIAHVPIPVYHPRANGKVERFNRTMAQEWAYAKLYTSNAQRLRALGRWVEFYG